MFPKSHGFPRPEVWTKLSIRVRRDVCGVEPRGGKCVLINLSKQCMSHILCMYICLILFTCVQVTSSFHDIWRFPIHGGSQKNHPFIDGFSTNFHYKLSQTIQLLGIPGDETSVSIALGLRSSFSFVNFAAARGGHAREQMSQQGSWLHVPFFKLGIYIHI